MTVIIFIAILSSAPNPYTHELYRSLEISGKGYCTKAFEYIENNAQNGDAKCQCFLGNWYYFGEDRYWYAETDLSKAAYWWNEAAQKGHAGACNNLGMSYEYGVGVTKDLKKAVYWVKKGAELGNDFAMKRYGDMLRDGVYEDNSYYKRVKKYEYGYWFGDYDEIYVKNKKTILARDIEQAKYWWKKAASLGNKEAMERLQKIY